MLKLKTRHPLKLFVSRLIPFSLCAVFAVALTNACVTVNVNFPESAVQKASDDYVKDLYKAKEKGKTPSSSSPSSLPAKTPEKSSFHMMELLIPSAYAEGAEDEAFQIQLGPKAKEIQSRQASRISEIVEQKQAGLLGETADGLLVLRDAKKLKPLLQAKVDKLVKEENSDREALYDDVAKFNNLPALQKVRQSFARSFQKSGSPAGTWIEDPAGSWTQKK